MFLEIGLDMLYVYTALKELKMRRKSPFIGSVRRMMLLRGYSIRTEQSYLYSIKSYIRFDKHTHPEKMAKDEVVAFLDYLASDRKISGQVSL